MNLADIPVESLAGVGKQKKLDLAELGINTMVDLLEYFPYRYEDYRLSNLANVDNNEKITVKGKVMTIPSIKWFSKKKSRMMAKMDVSGLIIQVIWFNQAYLKEKIKSGATIVVSGKWDSKHLQMVVDRTFISEWEQQSHVGYMEPVYSVTGSIHRNWLRKIILEAFTQYKDSVEENLPHDLLSRYKLIPRHQAIYLIHFPKGKKELHQARRRLIYEELFLYELKIMWLKKIHKNMDKGLRHEFDPFKVERFVSNLSFPLTGAQERVVKEILDDLQTPLQMNRLLQGDVGSGKTIVAAIALYANYLSGFQGALMVPTEILAEQHAVSLQRLLTPYGMKIITLTGTMTSKERKKNLEQIELGLAHVVVGTHALIQDPVNYRDLGFAIIDEQHRFGVKQRALLREKGDIPDVLFMTATPIPRTLAITVFGEMDVSTIDEMPAGRQPIETHWVKKDVWPRVIGFIKKECEKGKQAYIVCPLIEESEKLDLQNIHEVFEELREKISPYQVGLLHGKMTSTEKEEVMRSFKENRLQVLIATTVIEVGVNVPNATMMIIYDADRFGLAQLHQLRGRVGRGGGSSTCVLVANPKTETGNERMRIMTETTDGFEISRRDLELRGAGDFLGVKQSGLPEFKLANIMDDFRVLEVARNDAANLVCRSDFMTSPNYRVLVNFLEQEKLDQKNLD